MLNSIHRFAIPIILLSLARTVSAQAPESATLQVTAQLISPITIGVTHPLDFGRLFAAGSKTVAPNAVTGGRVEVSGMSGSAVNLSITMPSTLKTATGDALAVMNWNYMLSSNSNLSGASSVAIASGTPYPVAAVIGGVSGVSKLYLGIGATVQTLASSPVGAYTATGQVTAAYADL